ncbi:MAG: tetratricopeptide repeat protein [Blastocatellia bacterium]|nr:tetratricopeptide repeat protein [Blastocatellia bacterium]
MSFSKANDLKKAEKLVQQGKIAAAIKEYSNLVAANPNDLTLINTLGDLCVRDGRIEEAILNFTKIGENYSKNGFTLKAIAMFKKVYKLAPSNPEIAFKLAELYAKQGLVVDARKQYMEVADAYTRSGRMQQALDVLRKIADLDPENTSVRLKLAENYQRERMNDKAHEAYVAAGSQLLRKGNLDESQQVFMKALSVDPSSKQALSSLANIFIQQGDPQKAVAMLSRVIENNPNDPDLMTLMGRTYLGANMLEDAERTFLALLEVDKSRFEYLLQLGKQFVDRGQFDRAVSLVDACMEIMITRRQESKAVDILNTITEFDPHHVGAFKSLRTIYTRMGEDHNLGETLKGMVEAALHHDDKEAAGIALRQLCELEPEDPSYRQRLQALGMSSAISPTLATRDIGAVPPPSTAPLVPSIGGSANFQLGTDLYPSDAGGAGGANFGFVSGTGFSTPAPTPAAPGAGSTSGTGFSGFTSGSGFSVESGPGFSGFVSGSQFSKPVVTQDIQKRISDADRYASRGYADKAVEILEEILAGSPHLIDVRLRLKDIFLNSGLNEKAADQCMELAHLYDTQGNPAQAQVMLAEAYTLNPQVSAARFENIAQVESSSGDSIEIDISGGFNAPISGSFPAPAPPPPQPLVDNFYGGAPHLSVGGGDVFTPPPQFGIPTGSLTAAVVDQEKLREELEGVDFYLSQGYSDLANDTLNRLEALYPNNPEVQSRRARLNAASAPPQPPMPSFGQATPSFDFSNLMSQPATPPQPVAPPPFGFDDWGGGGAAIPMPPVTPPYPMPVPSFSNPQPTAELTPPPPPPVVSPPPVTTPVGVGYDPNDPLRFPGPPSVDSLISSLITDLGDSLDGLEEEAKRITGAHKAAPPAAPVAAAPAPANDNLFGSLAESGLQDIFDEFKQSIEQEADDEKPDFETHYNLGLAYKDMELFDEAVEEFQTAIRATDSKAPDGHYFQSCNMLGLCFMAKGMPQPAAVWFKRGLDAPGRSEDEYQAMRFDLALANEEQGKFETALELFETVYALDINYRDVGEKIKEVKEKIKHG